MSSNIHVTGWGKEAGPAYSVTTSALDRKKNRRVKTVHVARKQTGKSYGGADYAVVEVADGRSLLLNKGHSYKVKMDYGGVEVDGVVDATAGYKVIPIGDDEDVKAVAAEGQPTEVEDNESELS